MIRGSRRGGFETIPIRDVSGRLAMRLNGRRGSTNTVECVEIIEQLQDLYERLRSYEAPAVVRPTIESLDQAPKKSFFGSLFSKAPAKPETSISEDLPKGLYMYGDVGCGKTMLMDLFYETLPPNISSKSRIHFHNFMQDVHKRMHVVKMRFGNDFDALPLVAADIAEKSSVLCFDEFQCTDVADAMILRRYVRFLSPQCSSLLTLVSDSLNCLCLTASSSLPPRTDIQMTST